MSVTQKVKYSWLWSQLLSIYFQMVNTIRTGSDQIGLFGPSMVGGT